MSALGHRNISFGRDAIGSTVITGNGNLVVVQSAGVVRDEPDDRLSADAKIGPNPYRGLLAFQETDADTFFGREKQIDRLWESLRALHDPPPRGQSPMRLLPVLGPSGSGKSSVVRAGLIPELARRPLPGLKKARVAVLNPGSHPLEAMATVLARIATDDVTPVTKTREFAHELRFPIENGRHDGLRRIAAALPEIASTPLIVVVDQFEEIYSLCADADERHAFVDNLLNAISDPAVNVSVIITLRTDFLGETQSHPQLNDVIAAHGAIVPAMNEDELRRAITEPAKLARRPLDDATVDLLINETEGREGALPLLQFALTRVWEGLFDGTAPTETLKKIGGVGGALAGEAQRIYDNLPDVEKKIARRVFLGLVQLGEGTRDTRRRVVVASLVAVGEDRDQVEEVVRRFSAPGVRLITLSAEADGDDTAEVTHEALFQHWRTLDDWLASGRDDLRFQRRLDQAARYWGSQNRAEGLLWRSPDLELLTSFHRRSGSEMSPIQMDFYLASKQAEEQRITEKERHNSILKRRLRTAIAFAAVAVLFAFAAGALGHFAESNRQKAVEARNNLRDRIAKQLEDATQALLKEGKPLDDGLIKLAREADLTIDITYGDMRVLSPSSGKPVEPFVTPHVLEGRAGAGAVWHFESLDADQFAEGLNIELWPKAMSAAYSSDYERVPIARVALRDAIPNSGLRANYSDGIPYSDDGIPVRGDHPASLHFGHLNIEIIENGITNYRKAHVRDLISKHGLEIELYCASDGRALSVSEKDLYIVSGRFASLRQKHEKERLPASPPLTRAEVGFGFARAVRACETAWTRYEAAVRNGQIVDEDMRRIIKECSEELEMALWEIDPFDAESCFQIAIVSSLTTPPKSRWYDLALSRAAALNKKYSVYIHFEEGYRHWMDLNAEKAIEEFGKALEIDPNFEPAHYWLGRVLFQIAEPAESHLTKAGDYDPEKPRRVLPWKSIDLWDEQVRALERSVDVP